MRRLLGLLGIAAIVVIAGALAWAARTRPGRGQGRGQGISSKEAVALAIHRGLDRRLSRFGVWVFRRTKGGIARPWNVDALILTTRGRRSGRERSVVLQYFPDGDAMVLAAANDGGRSHPGWYFNLVANPDAAVEIAGRRIDVRAEELSGDEAAAWWPRIVARDRNYDRYRRATDRRIPLVRLVPDAGQAGALQPRGAARHTSVHSS